MRHEVRTTQSEHSLNDVALHPPCAATSAQCFSIGPTEGEKRGTVGTSRAVNLRSGFRPLSIFAVDSAQRPPGPGATVRIRRQAAGEIELGKDLALSRAHVRAGG